MAHKKLEQYDWFPYIAWTICIVFALFVANLALELRTTADNLKDTSLSLQERMDSVEAMFNDDNATTSNEHTENSTN